MTLHKPSGLARVRLGGQDVYLGPWGSSLAEAEYRRVTAEWLAGGVVPAAPRRRLAAGTATVGELAREYKAYVIQRFGERTYRSSVRPVLVRLDRLYGHVPAAEFAPGSLETLLHACVAEPRVRGRRLSRNYINAKILPRVKRLFKWAARKGLVPASVWHGLCTVESLERGFKGVPDRSPVGPVADSVVEATLPHLPPVVADMVQVQRLTGMRPGEVCSLNWAEVDRGGDVWVYRPGRHKTAHQGKAREVPIGPRAQGILLKYLARAGEAPLFAPAESEAKRRAKARESRMSRIPPSQRDRDERAARNPRRLYRSGYTTSAYSLSVARAAKRAFRPRGMTDEQFRTWTCPEHWHPNQLRHTRATEIRQGFGLDAAGAVLGHAKIETTQLYAERGRELALSVARATG
jgi:integrase